MIFTEEDFQRAHREGWYVKDGNAHVLPRQMSRQSIHELIPFLMEKSKTSDWHRRIYLDLNWSRIEAAYASSDGWVLFTAHPAIAPVTTYSFPSDQAAYNHVIQHAENGSMLHIKALHILTKKRLIGY